MIVTGRCIFNLINDQYTPITFHWMKIIIDLNVMTSTSIVTDTEGDVTRCWQDCLQTEVINVASAVCSTCYLLLFPLIIHRNKAVNISNYFSMNILLKKIHSNDTLQRLYLARHHQLFYLRTAF
jgi:hypothetical protein